MLAGMKCRECGFEYYVNIPEEETACPLCGSKETDFQFYDEKAFSCG